MGEYLFTEKGFGQYKSYIDENDRRKVKRINDLLKSIDRDGPMGGIGKPNSNIVKVNTADESMMKIG